MLNESQMEQIKDLVSENCLKDKNGMFYSEIYANYDDELPENMQKKILSAENPLDEFYYILNEIYMDCEWDYENEIMNHIIQNEEISSEITCENIDTEEILDYLREIHYIKYPYDHYLSQKVCVDIIIDSGDANYDFTLNNLFVNWEGKDETKIDDCSSLLWLAKKQGYTKTQLTAALRDNNCGESKFLKSVYQEVANTTSGLNALVFMVQMELKELLELKKAMKIEENKNKSYTPNQRKGRGYLTVKKEVTCGLYDSWYGAGGVLEIALEKDLKIPLRFIHSADIDGTKRYSIKEIWGVNSSLWSEDVIKEIKPMKKKVA